MRLTGWIGCACISMFAGNLMSEESLAYPKTRKDATADTLHGKKVDDPYRLLEDDVRKSPEVKQWVEAENKVTFSYL